MKKTSTVALLCAMLFCLVLSACGSAGLADGFDSKQVTERAEAAVSLVPDGEGFKIERSALTLKAKVPGLDQAQFDELAQTAEKVCPVSRLLNAEITLEATLVA